MLAFIERAIPQLVQDGGVGRFGYMLDGTSKTQQKVQFSIRLSVAMYEIRPRPCIL